MSSSFCAWVSRDKENSGASIALAVANKRNGQEYSLAWGGRILNRLPAFQPDLRKVEIRQIPEVAGEMPYGPPGVAHRQRCVFSTPLSGTQPRRIVPPGYRSLPTAGLRGTQVSIREAACVIRLGRAYRSAAPPKYSIALAKAPRPTC